MPDYDNKMMTSPMEPTFVGRVALTIAAEKPKQSAPAKIVKPEKQTPENTRHCSVHMIAVIDRMDHCPICGHGRFISEPTGEVPKPEPKKGKRK